MDGTVTRINSDLIIKEPSGGIRFGTDALLLAGFALPSVKKGVCVDLGTGCGVIPLLMLSAGSKALFTGLEITPEYALAAEENAAVNGFSDRFKVIRADVCDFSAFPAGSADFAVMNPPYMRINSGKDNENPLLSVA
ncbi:MAG: methyltransferase, partial [Clostridia bacterium]|nr:methyltransferase [Clostridia bacterium]